MTLQEFLVDNKLKYAKYFLLDDPNRKFRIDEHYIDDFLITSNNPYNIRSSDNIKIYHKKSRFMKMIDEDKIKSKISTCEIPILFFKDGIPCILTNDLKSICDEVSMNCFDFRTNEPSIIDEVINSYYDKITHVTINDFEKLNETLFTRQYYNIILISPIFPIFISASIEYLLSVDILKYLPVKKSIYGKLLNRDYLYDYLMLPFKNIYAIYNELYSKKLTTNIRTNCQKISNINEIMNIIKRNTESMNMKSKLVFDSSHDEDEIVFKYILDCYYELLQMKDSYYIRRKINQEIINYIFDENNNSSYKSMKIQTNFIMP